MGEEQLIEHRRSNQVTKLSRQFAVERARNATRFSLVVAHNFLDSEEDKINTSIVTRGNGFFLSEPDRLPIDSERLHVTSLRKERSTATFAHHALKYTKKFSKYRPLHLFKDE